MIKFKCSNNSVIIELNYHYIESKYLLYVVVGHLISAICMIIFPFAPSLYVIILISIFFVCMQNCITISISLIVNRVPPSMRYVIKIIRNSITSILNHLKNMFVLQRCFGWFNNGFWRSRCNPRWPNFTNWIRLFVYFKFLDYNFPTSG